ncbi:MAG: TlpA family protein disulfide reductase [Nitrospira defluvii]|nr:TlpA family protein disulfide reductase [Nitrospira defluvii]
MMMRAGLLKGLMLAVVFGATAGPVWAEDPFATLKIARVAPGTIAAAFELQSLDGRSVQLADLKGKVVVVNFWATWCGPCKEEMPAFERLRQQLDPERFALLTITTDLQRDGIKHFLANLHVQLPVLFDENQDVSQAYLVRALPTTVLIDRQGQLVGRAVGPREWDAPQTVHLLQGMMQ